MADSETKWYEYDWKYGDSEAIYCVDLSYEDNTDTLGGILVCLICSGKKRTLTDSEYSSYERLRDKLIKKLSVQYVGLIEEASKVRFYMYASEKDISEQIEKFIRRIADRVSVECRFDTEHEFYLGTLCPDDAKVFTEENRKQLELFEETGDCMVQPRKLNFHLYFPSEPLRILFEEQARLIGFAIGDSEFCPEYELAHGSVVHKIMALDKHDVDDATTRLIYASQKHDGKLMFWDCVMVPKRKGL